MLSFSGKQMLLTIWLLPSFLNTKSFREDGLMLCTKAGERATPDLCRVSLFRNTGLPPWSLHMPPKKRRSSYVYIPNSVNDSDLSLTISVLEKVRSHITPLLTPNGFLEHSPLVPRRALSVGCGQTLAMPVLSSRKMLWSIFRILQRFVFNSRKCLAAL